jgi:PTS system fructose-specific IIA component
MSQLLTPELVELDLVASDRHEAARRLGERLVAAGRVTDLDGFLADVRAREEQMPTGLPGGIGIPHCRSPHVAVPTLAFGRSATGIDFGAEDGPATLIFMIAAPDGAGSEHMTILAALARRLIHESFRKSLMTAPDAQTVVDIVAREVGA